MTVRPTPAVPVAPGGRAAAAISETAKRILSSLQTSNSPLTDARRMPMRQPPLEEQVGGAGEGVMIWVGQGKGQLFRNEMKLCV